MSSVGDEKDKSVDPEPELSPLERMRLAELHLDLRDPRAAVAVLEPLAEAEAGKASVQLLLGRAYFAQAALERAAASFTRAVEIDPTDHWARFALGRALERQSRLAEARGQYRIAAALDSRPEYAAALARVDAALARRAG